jgi:hypothetical protein
VTDIEKPVSKQHLKKIENQPSQHVPSTASLAVHSAAIRTLVLCFRAIVWLQNRREATVERTRTTSSVRRDDPGEFRVGRLKHERVKVPRGESLMEWAENVMQIHADRKSVLEVRSRL